MTTEVRVSEERLKLDETELFLYGFCSTQIFIDYKENVDKKLKSTMVELANYYEEFTALDKNDINGMLLKQYKAFWQMAEPSFQKFYEEIQEVLAPPPSAVPKSMLPNDSLYHPEIPKLEKEIEELQQKYMAERYFLHELKHRQEVVESICRPLKDKVDIAVMLQKNSSKKYANLEKIDQKRTELMDKFMGHLDKKTLYKFIASDVEKHNAEEMLEKCLQKNRD